MSQVAASNENPGEGKGVRRISLAVPIRLLRQIISPIYFKELVQIALSRRTTITKAIFLFALLASFSLMLIPAPGEDSSMGTYLFTTVAYVELILAILVTPIVTAGAVSGERQANTLDLLFLTRLTSWNIVQDKGLSRISYMLYLSSLTFPFMFAAMLFGGIETFQVLQTITAIVSTIIFCGGIGVITSCFSKSYVSALVKSYVLIVVTGIALPILVGLITQFRTPWVVVATSPFFAIMVAVNPWMRGPGGLAAAAWPVMLGGSIAFYFIAALISAIRLRRDRQVRHARKGIFRSFANIVKTLSKWLQPARLYDFRSRHVGHYPIIWKNAGFDAHRLKSVLSNLWLFLLVLTFSFVAYAAIEGGSVRFLKQSEFYWMLFGLYMPLAALFTIVLGGESFTSDWQSGRMTLLLTSRISSRQFAYGTLLSLVRSCLMTWCIPLSFLAVGAIVSFVGEASKYNNVEFIAPAFFVILHMTFFLVLGMHISLWLKKTVRSIALTLLASLIVIVGPFLVAGIFGIIAAVLRQHSNDFFEAIIKIAMMLSPAFWQVVSCNWEMTEEILTDSDGTGAMLLIHVAIFAGATIAGILHLGSRFDRICGRQSHGLRGQAPTKDGGQELPKAKFGATPPPIPESARKPSLESPSPADKDEDPGDKLRQLMKDNPEALAAMDRIEQNSDLIAMAGASGLDTAIRAGDLEEARKLIEAGANLAAVYEDGFTPLKVAASCNNPEAIRLLVKHGADVNDTAMGVPPAVYIAVREGGPEALTELVKAGAELKDLSALPEPLFLGAAIECKADMFEALLQTGLDINAVGEEGETALIRSVKTKNVAGATWLLDHGADPSAVHEAGFAALHLATLVDSPDLVELLATRGDVDGRAEGATPLHFAAAAGVPDDIIRKLLEMGADRSIRDDEGNIAADVAAANGHESIERILRG